MAEPTFGPWPPQAGDSAGGASPLCVARFRLEEGLEQLSGQLGAEVFSGISSGGVGDYWLLIDPAFQSVLTDATALFLSFAAGDTAPRTVMFQPVLNDGYIAAVVTDDAGAPASMLTLWVTLYYDTEAPPT